jgi:hypothetical protein
MRLTPIESKELRHAQRRAIFVNGDTKRMSPKDATRYGTLGSILVERGQKEEGRRLLRELLKRSTSAADRRVARRFLIS